MINAKLSKEAEIDSRGRTPEYRAWCSARNRCRNPRNRAWENYGGRGIKFSSKWDKFSAFLQDVGKRPAGTSLHRVNNNWHYEPGNVVWAGAIEQHNVTRVNRIISVAGEQMTVAEASRSFGIHHKTIDTRLRAGMSETKAATAQLIPNNGSRNGRGPK